MRHRAWIALIMLAATPAAAKHKLAVMPLAAAGAAASCSPVPPPHPRTRAKIENNAGQRAVFMTGPSASIGG